MVDRHRVLIVDGDAERRNTMADIVRAIGDTPVEASSHDEASELLPKFKADPTLEFDYFLVNLVIPLSNGGAPAYAYGITLVDKIRKDYPKSIEYPIIALKDSSLGKNGFVDLMKFAVNCFLPLTRDVTDNIDNIRININIFCNMAFSRRNEDNNSEHQEGNNSTSIPEKAASNKKLVVDLIADRHFFKGIELPSGKGGLQQRHKVFLFILARNPGRAMSHEDIHKEIRKFYFNDFEDTSSNIRSQIRKTLKALAQKHPDKITEHEINSLFRTERKDKTILTLPQKEIFTICGNETYPSSL